MDDNPKNLDKDNTHTVGLTLNIIFDSRTFNDIQSKN